jgi:tetratricopeptide (TPR) repeat protein
MSEATMNQEEVEKNDDLFNKAIEKYNNKESYDSVIETFEEGLKNNSKDSSYYTCLSWLFILRNKGNDRKKAIDYAKNALKFEATNAQAQYNLVLAYMLTGRKGIREEFERAISMSREQDIESAKSNLKDAISREGNQPEFEKLLKWIEQA